MTHQQAVGSLAVIRNSRASLLRIDEAIAYAKAHGHSYDDLEENVKTVKSERNSAWYNMRHGLHNNFTFWSTQIQREAKNIIDNPFV